jgi:acid phosphatase
MFVRGYLGPNSNTLGQVITVNSTGSPLALGDSLSPSDLCPAFVDGNGGTYATSWDDIYLPPITARLNKLLDGDLIFEDSDVSIFPYLCGFESQITGYLSPWCGVFTDDELKSYEYRQDLRYYYGMGPGTDLPSTMMLPFLNSTLGLLAKGPGVTAIAANGSTFELPHVIVAFANDGQMAELVSATGVYDESPVLSGTKRTKSNYISSHFVSMRGTVGLERLTCAATANTTSSWNGTTTTTNQTDTYVRILFNDAVYLVPKCQSGPGKSCPLSDYVDFIAEKYAAAGNWHDNCNVTNTASPTDVLGASFFTDLTLPWLASVVP